MYHMRLYITSHATFVIKYSVIDIGVFVLNIFSFNNPTNPSIEGLSILSGSPKLTVGAAFENTHVPNLYFIA